MRCSFSSRPAADDVMWIQELTPYLSYLGPVWLRRFLLQLVPIPRIQRLKIISNIVTKRTEEIYLEKKAAIESGDTDLLRAVGEGKDIMSVLCKYTRIYAIFKVMVCLWRLWQ